MMQGNRVSFKAHREETAAPKAAKQLHNRYFTWVTRKQLHGAALYARHPALHVLLDGSLLQFLAKNSQHRLSQSLSIRRPHCYSRQVVPKLLHLLEVSEVYLLFQDRHFNNVLLQVVQLRFMRRATMNKTKTLAALVQK
jgi:hypothetical protein